MKLANLYESTDVTPEYKAKYVKFINDTLEHIATAADDLEGHISETDNDVKVTKGTAMHYGGAKAEITYPDGDQYIKSVHLSADASDFIHNDTLEPAVCISLNIGIKKGTPAAVFAKIKAILKDHKLYLKDHPWYHEGYSAYVAGGHDQPHTWMPADMKRPMPPRRNSGGSHYDPRANFMNSPGERARQARAAGHQHFGGHDSNYTR